MIPGPVFNEYNLLFEGRGAMLGEENPGAKMPDGECRFPGWLGGDLKDPGTLEIDAEGNVTLCPGICIGNTSREPLADMIRHYDYRKHPIISIIADKGPIGLHELAVSCGYREQGGVVDECHLCYAMRKYLHKWFPQHLSPAGGYEDDGGPGAVIVRDADERDIHEIHDVLANAFRQYHKDYTDGAYNITVVSVEELGKRLRDPEKVVFVAQMHDSIVGTITIDMSGGCFYVQSMAVSPFVQKKGIGILLLQRAEEYAVGKGIKKMLLECYEPLVKAIRLYEKFGFRRTGKSRPYSGITVFEMAKDLREVSD
jgi:GNAT superfamily N-acetyltransferase